MSTMKHPNIIAGRYELVSSGEFPAMNFKLPHTKECFTYAIYGQQGKEWVYWDDASNKYVSFNGSTNGINTACLNKPTNLKDGTFTINLPTDQSLGSGAVIMFFGASAGVPVSQNKPSAPTPDGNPDMCFGLFEVTYTAPDKTGAKQSLDVDITVVDQISFPFTAHSDTAPFPLTCVGIPLSQNELIERFKKVFDSSGQQAAFYQCLQESTGQLVAPQDILQKNTTPKPPSYCGLAPATSANADKDFPEYAYFYRVSETYERDGKTTETAGSAPVFPGAFKGNLNAVHIGWLKHGTAFPGPYKKNNPISTGLRLYRAREPKGTKTAPADLSAYELLTEMSITQWNAQSGYVYVDDTTRVKNKDLHPHRTDYGFNPLSMWFDDVLQGFFGHYYTKDFWLYQDSQEKKKQNGTLWRGSVQKVMPKCGEKITSMEYINSKGTSTCIDAKWTWGDGKTEYFVLQLVGNAYDPADLSNSNIKGMTTLSSAEYEGAVINVYFPYFAENTDLLSMVVPQLGLYKIPPAPSWMQNHTLSPSQMVFACSGVFASGHDTDASSQTHFAGLATAGLANIENVIVSAINRGVAYDEATVLTPQQYTCLYTFSAKPTVNVNNNMITHVPPSIYTYYLAGVLSGGRETTLSVPQTVELSEAAQVGLTWLPQRPELYKAVRIYRQVSDNDFVLIGEVENTAKHQATGFLDTNSTEPASPHRFYGALRTSGAVNCNSYSGFLHRNWNVNEFIGVSINGLAYGYPFDDQGGFSTNISYGAHLPKRILINIGAPWNT
ncbi:hypothetical protein [Pseudovibrio sp. WM33]|uniref:hypothetical protein n=1 Tax=Pseudovibrio sp. WM33 TaxID=1735585 RepID=UPI0007AE85CC|nr:hypothetical protein [Pseudovibrio sp. WM33]KZL27918.1 hypothetical protein PsWM33_00677 [Pseudovibrio sp. WM33]